MKSVVDEFSSSVSISCKKVLNQIWRPFFPGPWLGVQGALPPALLGKLFCLPKE